MIPFDAGLLIAFLIAAPLCAFLILASRGSCVLARWRGWMPRDQRAWVDRRAAWIPAASLLGLYALAAAWGSLVEVGWIRTTTTEIRAGGAVQGQPRFRIVHLSDLHLESFGRREERVVEAVRAAKPRLVLLTGDLVNVREGVGALDRLLGLLKAEAPLGIYAVAGHTDGKFVTAEALRRAGAVLLDDDSQLVAGGGRGLRLVGQALEPMKPLRDLLRGISDDAFTIFLHHSPDAADELAAREPGQRVDLFLCGHTHGGQIRLPFRGAITTFTKHPGRYEQGLYDVQGVPMYVNRGVGVQGLPLRLFCRPEVAVIDLVAGP